MPIVNTGMKREAFLRNIAIHLSGESRFGITSDGEIYFGGGYWRGKFLENEIAVFLYNPSVPYGEARIVEQALCILLCGKYEDDL